MNPWAQASRRRCSPFGPFLELFCVSLLLFMSLGSHLSLFVVILNLCGHFECLFGLFAVVLCVFVVLMCLFPHRRLSSRQFSNPSTLMHK